jgi:uncharacterized integral membrane protein
MGAVRQRERARVKYFSWIISLPLLAIAVIFAVQHRQRVGIDLWPLPIEVAPPLYLLVMLAIFVGFVAGGFLTWISQGKHRKRARQRRYEAERLERELEQTRKKLDAARGQIRETNGEATTASAGALPGARTAADRTLPGPDEAARSA